MFTLFLENSKEYNEVCSYISKINIMSYRQDILLTPLTVLPGQNNACYLPRSHGVPHNDMRGTEQWQEML